MEQPSFPLSLTLCLSLSLSLSRLVGYLIHEVQIGKNVSKENVAKEMASSRRFVWQLQRKIHAAVAREVLGVKHAEITGI